jgi:hypothetical protein
VLKSRVGGKYFNRRKVRGSARVPSRLEFVEYQEQLLPVFSWVRSLPGSNKPVDVCDGVRGRADVVVVVLDTRSGEAPK